MAQVREQVRTLLQTAAKLDAARASNLELGIYNWTIEFATKKSIVKNWACKNFMHAYQDKARSMIANIDASSYIANTRLATRIDEGEFAPRELPFMANDRVFPELWEETVDRKLKREQTAYEETSVASTELYKCGRCKKNKCKYTERQMRSCDEPTTVLLLCLNCGHRWKI